MEGAGHHVRAKTNTPIIGILTQPIPRVENDDSAKWMSEFQRIQKAEFESRRENDMNLELDEVFRR